MTQAATPSALPKALGHIRVLDLSRVLAGPWCSQNLADLGADVIKIERPGNGDDTRAWGPPYAKDAQGHDTSEAAYYLAANRGKRSITLDISSPEGQQIVRDLVKDADIVIENFRPGTLEAWGLGWEQLKEINPALIMVRVSGYGQTGPYRDRPGFAAIAESMGGLRYLAGYPDRPPVRVGVSIGDTLASLYGVIGALLAMHHLKVNGGNGQFVDIALYEAVFGVMESLIPEFSGMGFIRERSGASLPGISPSNTYPCKDGRYVIIAGNSDSIFRRLMQAIGRKDLADDPRLARNDGRVEHNTLIDHAITDWTLRHGLEEVLEVLETAAVPSGRIYTAADIHADPHYRARGMIESCTLPDGKPIEMPGIVPKLSESPGETKWLGPALGEHTDALLAGLGFTGEKIQDLRARGIV